MTDFLPLRGEMFYAASSFRMNSHRFPSLSGIIMEYMTRLKGDRSLAKKLKNKACWCSAVKLEKKREGVRLMAGLGS